MSLGVDGYLFLGRILSLDTGFKIDGLDFCLYRCCLRFPGLFLSNPEVVDDLSSFLHKDSFTPLKLLKFFSWPPAFSSLVLVFLSHLQGCCVTWFDTQELVLIHIDCRLLYMVMGS